MFTLSSSQPPLTKLTKVSDLRYPPGRFGARRCLLFPNAVGFGVGAVGVPPARFGFRWSAVVRNASGVGPQSELTVRREPSIFFRCKEQTSGDTINIPAIYPQDNTHVTSQSSAFHFVSLILYDGRPNTCRKGCNSIWVQFRYVNKVLELLAQLYCY